MCEICRQTPCHYRCPNYIPPKATHYCSICDKGIYDGEEYIESSLGEYIHYECIESIRELLELLGWDVKIWGDF